MPLATDRRDLLVEHLRSLPLSAYDALDDTTGPQGLIGLLGTAVEFRPVVFCEALGAWENGFTAIVPVPAAVGGGVAALCWDPYAARREWDDLDLFHKIRAVVEMASKARHGATVLDLCVSLVGEVADVVQYGDADDAAAVSLNEWHDAWMLGHGVSLLDDADRAAWETMAALRVSPQSWESVRAVLARATNLIDNVAYDDDCEHVIRAAVVKHNGVELTGRQIESLHASEALMGVPRTQWPEAAARIVAARYADGLDASYHPAPPQPERKPAASAADRQRSGWPFALSA